MAWTSRAFRAAWRKIPPIDVRTVALVSTPATIAIVSWFSQPRKAYAFQLTDDDKTRHHVYTDHRLTKRELRFLEYASIEYDDVIYMSPMDFIDSLTRDGPRERVYRRVLKAPEVQKMMARTPPLRKKRDVTQGSKNLFRTLDQNGLISYGDYIFLVTLLTKSKSAFKIAFQMFDDDESGRVDKEEFLLACQLDLSEFSFVVKHLHKQLFTGSENFSVVFAKSEEEVKREDTTLLLHLFGLRGRETLTFEHFKTFYDNLQYELMEIEFREYARGKMNISPLDFAYLVLRYTVLARDEYAHYVDRVTDMCSADHPVPLPYHYFTHVSRYWKTVFIVCSRQGISLSQWKSFSLFLNNLQQFATAVRLYTNADMPVSKAEFARAVQCTCGERLDDSVIDLIFAIFDANMDGKLSYREFLGVMNDRLHRGLKNRSNRGWTWKAYKNCVINEMGRP